MGSIRAASLAGVAFAALLAISLLLLRDQPDADAGASEISDFYLDSGNRTRVLVGLNLAPFAAIAFFWFVGVIRRRIGDREDKFFSTVFLSSGLLFIAMYLAAAVVWASHALAVQFADSPPPSPEMVGLTQGLAWGFFSVVGARMAAVFMLVTSTLGHRTGALPRWLVVVGFVLALTLLVTVTVSEPVGFVFVVWVTLVSLALLVGRNLALSCSLSTLAAHSSGSISTTFSARG